MTAKYSLFIIEVFKALLRPAIRGRQFSVGERNYDLK